jgi:hypothetical protein
MSIVKPIIKIWEHTSPIGWITKGTQTPGHLSVVEQEGRTALKIINGPRDFFAVKPARATLLATPYLSWFWNMESQRNGQHPVNLFVGFYYGEQLDRTWIPSFLRSDETFPTYNRMLRFTWGDSALQRGTIVTNNSINRDILTANFTVRGGQENSGSWWLEAVDLYDIYQRAWPKDVIMQTKIKFIGLGATSGEKPIAGYISNVRLSR